MGFAKDQWLREIEQGFRYIRSDKVVCAKCFQDEAIQDLIRSRATERRCSYCRRRSKKPIAASMNEVLELISEGLHREYADPIHENAREDGEWVIAPRDTADVFAGIDPITENMDVFDEMLAPSSNRIGSANPYGDYRKTSLSATADRSSRRAPTAP